MDFANPYKFKVGLINKHAKAFMRQIYVIGVPFLFLYHG